MKLSELQNLIDEYKYYDMAVNNKNNINIEKKSINYLSNLSCLEIFYKSLEKTNKSGNYSLNPIEC